jgi:hypothetical protein
MTTERSGPSSPREARSLAARGANEESSPTMDARGEMTTERSGPSSPREARSLAARGANEESSPTMDEEQF